MHPFDDSYKGTPPWDIGRPQREFLSLAESGDVTGDLIDLGCGTGEHSILFASRGHKVLGIDSAPHAIQKARMKAAERGSDAEFLVWDALEMKSIGRKFHAAIDCGLFHVFPDHERRAYVKNLASVVLSGGNYFMLCMSIQEPSDWGGPRRISREEIEESFSAGWRVDYVRPAVIETTFHPEGGKAWFSCITRLE